MMATLAPLNLTCQVCGQEVSLPFWQPLARCPRCHALGYPDRARRNLLRLGWECPACGAANDGLVNFCLACGAGLTSRCLRCEAPVYGTICLHCGEHQARLRQLQTQQTQRADWIPVQRARIQEQRARLEELKAEAQRLPPATAGAEARPARSERRSRNRRRGGLWRMGWGWMFLVWGVIMLVRQAASQAASVTAPTAAQVGGQPAGWTGLEGWWQGFVPSLARIPTLTPQDPAYAFLFGAGLLGLIALLFGAYIIDRVIRRLFP